MGLINLLVQDPFTFVLVAVALLYSIIVHELAHAWVADRMGDSTARWMGRLTLNPLSHLDPIGTIMLFFVGFGWAKPVPVNFENLHPMRRGMVMVSAAGITANMFLAFVALLLFRLFSPESVSMRELLSFTAQINIMLAAFNLIPIPPLDGSRILLAFLSQRTQYTMARIEPYGMFIIVGLLYIGALNPLIYFFRWLILNLIGLFLL